MKRSLSAVASACICLLYASSTFADSLPKRTTQLDEYIRKPDPSYSWKLHKTIPGDGCTTYVVDLVSQTWRTPAEVDRPVWQHWLTVVKPDQVKFDTAHLRIGGGSNGRQPPEGAPAASVQLAKNTNAVVVDLGMIPNQPLVFNGDGKKRVEDDLIAYCWIKYMETGDPTWLPRFPMTKSAVRAMDAVTELLASEQGGKISIKKFIVAGGSKRGWTTWITAAVDPRVAAIIPAVIDVVNVRACMTNHFCAYGFWAPAIKDYVNHKVTERFDAPEYESLLKLVDPYCYRERYNMPKFIVNASGDQFFTPDSSQFYFGDLPAPKYLRYVPNADHSLRGSDALDSIEAFSLAVMKNKPLPQFSWKLLPDGSIRVETKDKPKKVTLWQATNPKARDFRLESVGPIYKCSPLTESEPGVYIAKVNKPEQGWTAFYAELTFDSGDRAPYKFSTQVRIVPEVLPHSIEEYRRTLKNGGKGGS